MAPSFIDSESWTVRMANALDDLDRINHEAARIMAYQRAGIPHGEAMAYDRDAHRRQIERRELRARGVIAVGNALGLEGAP